MAAAFSALVGTGLAMISTASDGVPTPTANAGPSPRAVALSPTEVDGGAIPVEKSMRASFVIANQGEGDLHLGQPKMRILQGCCPVDPQLATTKLAQGARTELPVELTMHKGMGGPHRMLIEVPTDDPATPVLAFRLKAEWVE